MDLNMTPAQDDPDASLAESLSAFAHNNTAATTTDGGYSPNVSVSFKDAVDDSFGDSKGDASLASPFDHQMNESISDPTTELTEEDIFRMKSMSIERNGWKHGPSASELQSAVSLVDSASNYIEEEGEQNLGEGDDAEGHEDGEDLDEEGRIERAVYVDTNVFIYDGFAFGRTRSEKPELNKDTVSMLHYPFEPAFGGSESEEYRRAFTDAQVYLVGTAHFSRDSCQDVLKTVAATQPDFVMVELCSSRIQILSMDEQTLLREAQALTRHKIMAIIKENGVAQGLMQVLLLSLSAHITQQLGMAPGGEFRAAHVASKMVPGCGIILGDRPLNVTLQRALGSLGFFQRMKFFFHLLVSLRMDIKQEDVEKCKDMDLLEELLKEMAGEFPQVSRILVDERDQYMTQVLHTLIQRATMEKLRASKKCRAKFEPVTVVAVVGMGHVAGIRSNWTKQIDASSLLTVPRPSLKSKVFKTVFKIAVFGMLGYGMYRAGSAVVHKITATK